MAALNKIVLSIVLLGTCMTQGVQSLCKDEYMEIGCFSQYASPFNKMKMLFNDRNHILWGDFRNFLTDLACKCREAAAKDKYTHFSIRFWGICMAGNLDDHDVKRAMKEPKRTSHKCSDVNYARCVTGSGRLCAGGAGADYLFKVNHNIGYQAFQKVEHHNVLLPNKPAAHAPVQQQMFFQMTHPPQHAFPTFPSFPIFGDEKNDEKKV